MPISLKRKKIFQKEKRHSSVFFFHFIGTLNSNSIRWCIVETSSGLLGKSSVIFGNFRKIFGNVRVTSGKVLKNLQKSSERVGNLGKIVNNAVSIIKKKHRVSSKI